MDSFRLCLMIYLALPGATGTAGLSDLITHLFTNYHNDVKPECGNSSIQVKIGLALRQIIDLNEPKQLLTINVWLRWAWEDCNLKWNASEFGDINNVIVLFDRIWIPDITLYDNAESTIDGVKEYRPKVYSSGEVAYNFPTVITSMCQVDVTYFPFDTQTCVLTFGSWAYNGLELDVTNRSLTGDLSSFVSNVEWDVVAIDVKRHETFYGCCPEPYPDVTFYLRLDRKPLFYLMNLMFPCLLISSVACLGFLLPPDSGEKVSLEITVLLSLAVFLLVVSETLPPSSETFPYIGVYFLCAMLLVSVSCLMTVIVLNLHYKGNHGKEVPQCIRHLFLGILGRLVRVKVPQKSSATVSPATPKIFDVKSFEFDLNAGRTTSSSNGILKLEDTTEVIENNKVGNGRPTDNESAVNVSELMKILKKQLEALCTIERFMRDHKKWEDNVGEWQLVGQVVDRIFLAIFIFISFTTTLAIFVQTSSS